MNDHELSVTRYIDAQAAEVWDVMANRIEEWWCPRPWRAEFDKLERRPGGASTCTMYGPEGEVHPHPGIVLAWDEGKRFAFTDAIVEDLEPAGPFMIGIWSIAPEDGGTHYTAVARHWTREKAEERKAMGFD